MLIPAGDSMIDHDQMKYDRLCERYKALLIELKVVQGELLAIDKQVGHNCTGSNYRVSWDLAATRIDNLITKLMYDESSKGE